MLWGGEVVRGVPDMAALLWGKVVLVEPGSWRPAEAAAGSLLTCGAVLGDRIS